MARYILLFLLLLCAACFSMVTSAQQQYFNYATKGLSQDDGLSQGSNYFRYEDSKGFMWITGNDALNRYDGSTVKVFNLNRYFKGCPPLQQGYGFAEDEAGNIYVGSVNGLYIYHRKTDKFTLQKIYADSNENLAMPFAFKEHKVWCFNRKYEIVSYDITNKQVSAAIQFPLPAVNSVHVYDMLGMDGFSFYYRFPFFDNNNNIWCFGAYEIFQYDKAKKALQRITLHTLKSNHALILCTYFDKEHNELLLGTDKGLVVYDMNNGKERFIKSMGSYKLGEVNSIACKGDVIALRSTSGSLFSDRKFIHYCWANNPSKMLSRRVYDLGFDKSGRLWMCDDGLGQVIYNFSQFLLPKMPGNNSDLEKMKERGVGGFAEMPNGDLFFQNCFLLQHASKQLKNARYIHAALGYEKWFRTETDLVRKGVWMYGLDNNRQQLRIYFIGTNEIPVPKYVIPVSNSLGACNTLKVWADGRILISFSNGLFWLKEGKLVQVKTIPNKSFFTISPLSNNRYAISYLNKDMLLVKSDSTDNIRFIQTILPGVQSFYMQEDTLRHRYWIGTNKGVYLLDRNFKTVQHFDANIRLSGTYIYGLLLDDDGNAWCSHQHGLSSIDARTFQITNYDKDDGIQDWDFNNRAFYKATDGTLFFGGVGGFNYFKPPLKSISYYNPEVYVDEILINDNIFLPDSNANEIKELYLRHKDNNIVIKVIVKDLDNTNELIYKLRETDVQWKHLANKSVLTFNSLAPGNYMLELGVFDKYRHQNLRQKIIRIIIEAPFYLRPLFWVVVAILVTAMIAWWINRVKLLKQRTAFRQQLALEKQRNKITADLHDDIGASLSSLQVNSMVAYELLYQHPDRAQKVLEKISVQSKKLSESIGDIIWSMKPGKDEFMTMGSRIRNFANDIMGDTDIQYQIDIDTEANTLITDITVRKNIVFITKEAINNVVKYSKATNLCVTLQMKPDIALLSIEDNGIGFEWKLQKGNGITNMKRRAEEIDGEWLLESAPMKGTKISIKIPLNI